MAKAVYQLPVLEGSCLPKSMTVSTIQVPSADSVSGAVLRGGRGKQYGDRAVPGRAQCRWAILIGEQTHAGLRGRTRN